MNAIGVQYVVICAFYGGPALVAAGTGVGGCSPSLDLVVQWFHLQIEVDASNEY